MSTYEISKSSLISLKAEILRKQGEVAKIKLENREKSLPKKPNPLDLKNDKKKATTATPNHYKNSAEDEELIRKSKSILEAKAKLFDKLVKSGIPDNDEPNRYLVRFDEKNTHVESSSEDEIIEDYEPAQNSDDEWVEYTDCLGRSRKCLRKDLEYLKSKDKELQESVDKKRLERCEEENICKEKTINEEEHVTKVQEEEPDLMSSDMRREELRKQWEKEEEILSKKDNVHYQDVLFGEARTHGVGYYGFSKDEDVRAEQQAALRKLREETKQQQRKAQDLRAIREKQLAMRAKAARNRKRARMGLPPEEDEAPETPVEEKASADTSNESDKILEEQERLKEEARKKHIRPWDIGKDGLKKEHYEYTQEEWVDKQRKERNQEFAPPSSYNNENEKYTKNKAKHSKPRQDNLRRGRNVDEYSNVPDKTNKMTPEPIHNELSSEDESDIQVKKANKQQNPEHEQPVKNDRPFSRYYAAIPPPDNLDNTTSSKPKKKKLNTEESIMAGLQFLRQQAERKSSTPRNEDMFLM